MPGVNTSSRSSCKLQVASWPVSCSPARRSLLAAPLLSSFVSRLSSTQGLQYRSTLVQPSPSNDEHLSPLGRLVPSRFHFNPRPQDYQVPLVQGNLIQDSIVLLARLPHSVSLYEPRPSCALSLAVALLVEAALHAAHNPRGLYITTVTN